RNIGGALLDMGVSREVVCLDPPSSPYLDNDRYHIHALGPGRGPWHYTKALMPWLILNLPRFEVVIINGLWLYHSFAVWKAIKILKKRHPDLVPRVLVMPHGMLDPYFQRAKGRKLKAVRNWVYWKLIERKVVNDANGLLFTCETEMLLARKAFKPYKPVKEHNAGYGIEAPPVYEKFMTDAFEKLCPGLDGHPYLLFLSRIHQKKGIDLLIKAYISIFNNENKGVAPLPKLVIAGPGLDTSFGKKIQNELMRAPQVKPNVFFPGMLYCDAKWGAFYGCEAFVLPSHQENFGIAVAEALACSKPVLISDQVNIWREIEMGGAGIIGNDFYEGTREALLKWINLNPKNKQVMGINALATYN
ncbi:MAG: glycosyltransferase, partial [Candidatus Saccharimonadales bacterium]